MVANIKSILSTSRNYFVSKSSNYSHIQDSYFRANFLEKITGNLYEKVTPVVELEQNSDVDEELYTDYMEKQKKPKYQEMLLVRKKLPSYKMKDQILDLIERNHICVISGDTGCGKTTQIPQFILDHFLTNKKGSMCNIVCTQPKRISTVSIAKRVADERAEKPGRSVGYHIRLER